MTGRVILTAAEMRAAEKVAIDAGTPVEILMDRAGTAAAEAIWRYAGPLSALVLCGPGNNGGDGYVIARRLKERGMNVRVAALGEPHSPAARAARDAWAGPVGSMDQSAPAPLLIDALFGTGLARPLDHAIAASLIDLAAKAKLRVAVDLPSGAATDDGRLLSAVPDYDLTITFATLKPSHLLQSAARHMGRLVVADIGIDARSHLSEIGAPKLRGPGPGDHKYTRGYVAVAAGQMLGAAALSAAAAMRSGAGYVRLIAPDFIRGVPSAIVQSRGDPAPYLADERIDAIAVGPGLGRGEAAEYLLQQVLRTPKPLVLDADALVLLAGKLKQLHPLHHVPIITPHAGEFASLFGRLAGSKVEQARQAAVEASAVVIFKGPDTVVASPDGRAAIAASAPSSLATAGTGDVLTGIVAAMRARGLDAFEAACAGVWLHGRAARQAGPALIADDLIAALPAALAACGEPD